jgi:Domain of unknown function (DUF4292)
MKHYFGILILLLLVSCKSKAVLTEGTATGVMLSSEIIANHYKNKKDFKTLYIKADVSYEDAKQSQSLSAEIKIQKDQKILVSLRFLGITMAKALITPEGVKYYEKLNGNYFEGNYGALTAFLGTDLDFQKVQNLLIGQALDDLNKGKYKSSLADNLYQLGGKSSDETLKIFTFEASKFLLKKQQINQVSKARTLEIIYPEHKEYTEAILPAKLLIEANQTKGKTNIEIDYNTISFNEELSFPYSVPESYKQIFID